MSRSSTAPGESCWKKLWSEYAGCKPENLPPYETWHNSQSVEVLAIDAVTWANTKGSERHEKGCYGNEGPPPKLDQAAPLGTGRAFSDPMAGSGGRMPGAMPGSVAMPPGMGGQQPSGNLPAGVTRGFFSLL